LDRREVTLNYQSSAGPGRAFQITNDAAFKIKVGTRDQSFSMLVRVEAQPTWFPADADGDTRGRLRYSSVSLGMKENGEPVKAKDLWRQLNQQFLKTTAELRLSDDGAVVYAQPDLRKADPQYKEQLVGISDLVLQAVELLSLPPAKQTLVPKSRLRAQRTMLVGLPGFYIPTMADVKYQYLGVRKKHQEETAYFELTADLRPRRGDDGRLNGKLTGVMEVSLITGEVLHANSNMHVDFDAGGTGLRLIGTLGVGLAAIDPRPKSVLKPQDLEAKSTPIPEGHAFEKGQRVYAFSEAVWHDAEVLAVNPAGQPKIHYIGWADYWDAFVTKERVRLPKPGTTPDPVEAKPADSEEKGAKEAESKEPGANKDESKE
jgi:hypothetical protein